MTTYTALVEQAEVQSWSAYVPGSSLVWGAGKTRKQAMGDLQAALDFWAHDLRQKGMSLPSANVELVTVEVAA